MQLMRIIKLNCQFAFCDTIVRMDNAEKAEEIRRSGEERLYLYAHLSICPRG